MWSLRGFSLALLLRLPATVQKHAREMSRELEIVHKCVREYELLYVFQCGPAEDGWMDIRMAVQCVK